MRKILFLLVIFSFSFVSAFAQISEILKRMEEHRKLLKTLSADIMMTKFSIRSGGTYTKEGAIKFMPLNDYSLRFDSTKPAPESFLTIKNQYLLYQPNLKTAYAGVTDDAQKNTFIIFSILSKERLKTDYNIKYLGEDRVSGTIPAWHLELTPKTTEDFKTIELWVDGNGMPLQSKAIENGGDWTSVLLANLQKNITIKGTDFKIDLPKKTELIKN